MSEEETFEIDFSEAKTIANLPTQVKTDNSNTPSRLESMWGFSAEKNHIHLSGPCALGTVLYFYGIGWNHLPKRQNGRPMNNAFVSEVMRWSKSPDLPTNRLSTSPANMLRSLQRAGLTSSWYAANPFDTTLELIKNELKQDRPVVVLINQEPLDKPFLLEWQVVFRMTDQAIYTKHCEHEDAEMAWSVSKFRECLQVNPEQLSCSIITAHKQ